MTKVVRHLHFYGPLIGACGFILVCCCVIPVPIKVIVAAIVFGYIFSAFATLISRCTIGKLPWFVCCILSIVSILMFFYRCLLYIMITFSDVIINYFPSIHRYKDHIWILIERVISFGFEKIRRLMTTESVLMTLKYITKGCGFFGDVFGKINIFNYILCVVIFCLFLFKFNGIDRYFTKIKNKHVDDAHATLIDCRYIAHEIHESIKVWANAVIICGCSMFIFHALICAIFSINNPLLCGLVYAFSGVLPVVGDIIAWLLIIISALSSSASYSSVAVGMLCMIIANSCANHILVPRLIQTSFKLPIYVTIIGLLINYHMFGVFGILFNLQICLMIYVVIRTIRRNIQR